MVSKLVFVLVAIFGSVSWLGTNSVWMELPLLTANLPEGWGLPSYLAIVVQIACIGPLVYSILHKCFKTTVFHAVPLITVFLIMSCTCQFGLVFMWWRTILIGNSEYSLALYLLVFGLAIVNATSNVLFMPFMAQFHHVYLNAYFVGMGLSSLIPSLLSLAQGAGEYECQGMVPKFSPPRFNVSSFFLVISIWTVIATISFEVLCRRNDHKTSLECVDGTNEGTPLKVVNLESSGNSSRGTEIRGGSTESEVISKKSPKDSPSIKRADYFVVLLATALVNAQMNGVIPSVQSYAALPYSQATYHYGITLANVISPAVSFLPFILTVKSIPVLCLLTFCSSCVTAFILYLAALSPNLIFDSVTIGSILSVASALVAAALHSYLRVVFASLLREGEQSENRLFWCGVFIQIGSFLGSAVMFPLVNFVPIFTSAPPCR